MAVKKKTAGKKKIVKKVVKAAPKKKPTKKVAKTSSKKRGFGYESLFMSFEDGDESLIEDDTTVEDEDIAEVVVDTTASDETIDGINVSDVEENEDNTEAVERWLYSLESEVEEVVEGTADDSSDDLAASVVESDGDLDAEDGVNVVTEDEVYEEGDEAEEDGEEEVVVDTSDDDESDDTIEEVTVQDEDGDEYTAELGSAERWFRSVESDVEEMLPDSDPNISTEDDEDVEGNEDETDEDETNEDETNEDETDEDETDEDESDDEGEESIESLLFSISRNINKINKKNKTSSKSNGDLVSSIFGDL